MVKHNKKNRRQNSAIRKTVGRGAMTREYHGKVKGLIKELNDLRSTEITSFLQYKQHAYMAVSLFSPGFKGEFIAHANQELEHADMLAERIQQLGGVPVFDPEEIAQKARHLGVRPKQGSTVTEMIGEDLLLEREQVERYTALARQIQGDDPVTWTLLVQILAQTEKHASELSDFLESTTDTR